MTGRHRNRTKEEQASRNPIRGLLRSANVQSIINSPL